MSILTVNVCSLQKHLNDLEALIHSLESPPNVICFTETWLTDNDDIDSLLVPGYNNYAIKNRNPHGGGVIIQIQDFMSVLETHSTELEETLLVSLQYKKYRFKLPIVYNPPRTNKLKFVEKLDSFLNDLTSLNCPTVLTSDFNIDTYVTNQLQSNYLCTISPIDFELAKLETISETSNSTTCLDHFKYQNFASPEFSVQTLENILDHYPILMKWPINVDTEQNYLPFRDISFIKDQERLSNYITDLEWSPRNRCPILESDGTNELFTKINNLFLETANKCAPLKCLADKKSEVPKWFTNSLKNLRFKKNKAHRSMKQNPQDNEAAKKIKLLRDKFGKSVKNL